jgi:hypothetical protein
MITTTISVRGAWRYEGPSLHARGLLTPGVPVRLEPEPENPHDSNAVAIRLRDGDKMLGYVSRELAPHFSDPASKRTVLNASVASTRFSGRDLEIKVRLQYEPSDVETNLRNRCGLALSAAGLSSRPAVYAIKNKLGGWIYIGSSGDVKRRIREHSRELQMGTHANPKLQRDYRTVGPEAFVATVLEQVDSIGALAQAESRHIAKRIAANSMLYNRTSDGVGVKPDDRNQREGFVTGRPPELTFNTKGRGAATQPSSGPLATDPSSDPIGNYATTTSPAPVTRPQEPQKTQHQQDSFNLLQTGRELARSAWSRATLTGIVANLFLSDIERRRFALSVAAFLCASGYFRSHGTRRDQIVEGFSDETEAINAGDKRLILSYEDQAELERLAHWADRTLTLGRKEELGRAISTFLLNGSSRLVQRFFATSDPTLADWISEEAVRYHIALRTALEKP